MRLQVRATVLTSAAVVSAAAAQNCAPDWTAFPHDSINMTVRASVMFDFDGAGPQPPRLVIGGDFTRGSGRELRYIALWDGSQWQPVGPGLPSWVQDLAVYDLDGAGPMAPRLVATGSFGTFTFNGAFWSQLTGVLGANDLTTDPTGSILYSAHGNGIYRHTGGVGTLIGVSNEPVEAVAYWDPDGPGPLPGEVYAAGSFSTISGVSANRIARWNGTSWSALGSGIDGYRLMTLHVHDPDGAGPLNAELIAGGDLDTAGGLAVEAVAAWDGNSWSAMPGLNGWVRSLLSVDLDGPGPQAPSLLAGGGVGTLNPPYGSSVVRWDGSAWSGFGNRLNQGADTIIEFDEDGPGPLLPTIVVGGFFTTTWLEPIRTVPHIARLDGKAWAPMGAVNNQGVSDNINTMTVHDFDGPGPQLPELVVAGRPKVAGEVQVSHVARWSPSGWAAVGEGLPNFVDGLTSFDPDGAGPAAPMLIASGQFTINGPSIRQWNGSTWSSMPGAPSGFFAHAFAPFDADGSGPGPVELYAGGRRLGSSGSLLVRWREGMWQAVPGPTTSRINAVVVYDPDAEGPLPAELVVGGSFIVQGAVGVARWNGSSWSGLGTGINSEVNALAVFDEDGAGGNPPMLFAGGQFNSAGGQQAYGIARWNNAAWSRVGGGSFPSPPLNFSVIEALEVFDPDGPGPERESLFAGGSFGASLSNPPGYARSIARWDGTAWHALGEGVDVAVYALQAMDADGTGPQAPALYVGGRFRNVESEPSLHIARWGCTGTVCYANCDGSTTPPILNVADFSCFLQRFTAADPYANCDGSTQEPVLNVSDFGCFLQRFAAGCD